MARFRQAVIALSLLACACGGGAADAPAPKTPEAAAPPADASAARQRVFTALARVDRRLANRFGKHAEGVALLFPENRAPAELAALFDFDTRERALRGERDRLAQEAPRAPADGEWRALRRLVDEELARVADERELPRASSEIVRTLALDLPVKESRPEDVKDEDRALATTLDRLASGLSAGALGSMQLAELDDALDVFEKRSATLDGTQAALARLRVALSSVRPGPRDAVPEWSVTRARVEAFTGALPENFDRMRADAHARLKTQLDAALPRERSDRERLASGAVATLLTGADCNDVALAGARAPVERRGLCALLASLGSRKPNEPVEPAALLVADLSLDLADWAVAVHQRREEPAKVFARARTAVPLDELDAAHAFRFALAHPASAITVGWAAALLSGDPVKRAAAWNSKGPVRPSDAASMLGPDVM